MTGGVPPARQCTLPSCTNEATDPMEPGGLCESHIVGISASYTTEDTETEDENPGVEAGKPLSPSDARQVFTDRLEDAGLDTTRFIDVHDGEKRSTDHTQLAPDANELSGNYGVYGGAGATGDGDRYLVDVDVDDYEGERGPGWLPETFTIQSPHTDGDSGGHFYLCVTGDLLEVLDDELGNTNPKPAWGEIRINNQYCVGPGSEITECKHGCCTNDSPGRYVISKDVEIAALTTEEFLQGLKNDPALDTTTNKRDKGQMKAPEGDADLPEEETVHDRLERAFENPHDGDKLRNVYNGNYSRAGFSDRSSAEYWFANRVDSWVGHGNRATVERVMDSGYLQKWSERPDDSYRDSILDDVGNQDWYFEPERGDDPTDPYGDQVAVLPDTPDIRNSSSTWNWRHAGAERDCLTIGAVRDRTKDAIVNAIERSNQVLVESLPSGGKTMGTMKAAAETGQPITYLAPRREVMREVAEIARDEGLEVYMLPAFTRHCPTAKGDHGDDWQDTVRGWYNRGASPKDIHVNAEHELGRPLPCQEHDGEECPYTSMWRFDPDDYDVLIGHYNHGHKETVTTGRTVVFDEFPAGSFETTLSHNLEASVTAFLKRESQVPYSDYADLMENRTDEQRRSDALLWFTEEEPGDDPYIVFDTDNGHAKAPLAVFTLLAGSKTNLGNGWERCDLPTGGVGLFNRETNEIRLLETPRLDYTSGVIALDGTPTRRMWELSLGTRLNHRQVLSDDERREYIRDVLDLNLVQTSEYMKPYNNPDYVHLREDRALLEGIEEQHGQRPTVITSKAAEKQYLEEEILDETRDRYEHYGNLKSSNEFGTDRLGAVIGSQHYGDGFIKKWSAYAGHAVERNDGKGVDLSYGEFGDRVYQHMTHHVTLQAAMRFGRDGNGATVYVHTAALPDWVPVAGQGRVLKVWSDGMKEVLAVANGLGSWRTKDIVEHPDVSIGERQVRDHLSTLAERGHVDRETVGRGYVWQDDGLHEVSATGEVELDVVEDEATVAEVARKSTYTWEFRNSSGELPKSSSEPPSAGDDDPVDVLTDGGRDDPPPG